MKDHMSAIKIEENSHENDIFQKAVIIGQEIFIDWDNIDWDEEDFIPSGTLPFS